MRQSRLVLRSCLWIVSAVLMFSSNASAYIDPGTGSYILQMIIAGLIGATFTIKLFWKKLKIFVLSNVLKRRDQCEDNPAGEDE